jgi:hypothetical protein
MERVNPRGCKPNRGHMPVRGWSGVGAEPNAVIWRTTSLREVPLEQKGAYSPHSFYNYFVYIYESINVSW